MYHHRIPVLSIDTIAMEHSGNICFEHIRSYEPTQCAALYPHKRITVTFLAAAALREHNTWQQLFLAFSLKLWSTFLQPTEPAACLSVHPEIKTHTCPEPYLLCSRRRHTIYAQTSIREAVLFLYVCKSKSKWSHLASQYDCRLWKQRDTTHHCTLHQHESLALATALAAISLNMN